MVSMRTAFLALGLTVLGAGAARIKSKRKDSSNLTSAGSWRAVRSAGRIEVFRPAFLFLDEKKDEILISSFGKRNRKSDPIQWPFPAQSQILRLPMSDFEAAFKTRSFRGKHGKEISFVRDSAGLQWPNKLSRVPEEYGDYVVIPDGFLVPGKSDGNIFLADAKGRIHRITPQVKGAFYHEVEWHDFNGDGLKDILTLRVNQIGLLPGNYNPGEMIWLENPGVDRMTSQEWKTHIITEGPDVIFKTVPYQGGLAVFCTEFFREDPRISVRLLNMQGEQTALRVIDDTAGLPFAVNLEDLDGDGVKELLFTNHQNNDTEVKAGVFAYEVPWADLINGEYPRHTITYNPSPVKDPARGAGSPGFAYSFYPKKGMTGNKHIICAGDGSFDVWYMRPTGRFQYETQIVDFDGTTGELLLHDFDGDGIMDVLVPDNDEWGLHGITFEQR